MSEKTVNAKPQKKTGFQGPGAKTKIDTGSGAYVGGDINVRNIKNSEDVSQKT